jgi:hypothetical protein
MVERKPKPIVFGLRRATSPHRVLIVGRLYVGYVGIILNLPRLISFDLWFLKWQKGYEPS